MNQSFVKFELDEINNCNQKVKLGSSIISFENGKVKTLKSLIELQKPVKKNYSRIKYQFKTTSLNRKFKSRKHAKLV